MIRAVQEYFCVYGRCREVRLSGAARHPVLLSIAQMSAGAQLSRWGAIHAPGLRIQYRGHQEDLIALGCISRDRIAAARFARYEEDPRGALFHVANKAAPGRRGMIELTYIAQVRSFAAMMPGVALYCGDWLETLATRPLLRLVVDNRLIQRTLK